MNKSEQKLYHMLSTYRQEIQDSDDPHQTAQKTAERLANLQAKATDEGSVADVYQSVIEDLEDSMSGLRSVMPKQDFVSNGATDEAVKAMNASGDEYFINRNYDGVTPDIYKPEDALARLGLYMEVVKGC